MPKWWNGKIPTQCDTCDVPITEVFYDAKTKNDGPWGHLCPTCQVYGPGCNKVGLGLGQKYEKQASNDRFMKTDG